jgi:hypothetical protein
MLCLLQAFLGWFYICAWPGVWFYPQIIARDTQAYLPPPPLSWTPRIIGFKKKSLKRRTWKLSGAEMFFEQHLAEVCVHRDAFLFPDLISCHPV